MKRFRLFLTSVLFCGLLLLSACTTAAPPSRFEAAQQASTERGATAVVREAIPGGRFNAFFPPSEEAYEVVYVQEKAGFAEAKLKHNGADLAMLSIADLVNNPTAAAKYAESTVSIGGYPAVEQGSTMTGVLVAGHFQVKAQSRQPDFTASDRAAWLAKFDLDGLAAVQ